MYNGLRVIDAGSHDHRGHDPRDTDIDPEFRDLFPVARPDGVVMVDGRGTSTMQFKRQAYLDSMWDTEHGRYASLGFAPIPTSRPWTSAASTARSMTSSTRPATGSSASARSTCATSTPPPRRYAGASRSTAFERFSPTPGRPCPASPSRSPTTKCRRERRRCRAPAYAASPPRGRPGPAPPAPPRPGKSLRCAGSRWPTSYALH